MVIRSPNWTPQTPSIGALLIANTILEVPYYSEQIYNPRLDVLVGIWRKPYLFIYAYICSKRVHFNAAWKP